MTGVWEALSLKEQCVVSWPRPLGPSGITKAGLRLTWQEASEQGPKSWQPETAPQPGAAPVCSPREAQNRPSHPPCLLLTGGQAGAGCIQCRPSGPRRIAPAAGPPHCAAPHLGGLAGRGGQCGASRVMGAKTSSVQPRESEWPANHLPVPETPSQGHEGGTRRALQHSCPDHHQPKERPAEAPPPPCWLCSEWRQGHQWDLPWGGERLLPPAANTEGGEQGVGGRQPHLGRTGRWPASARTPPCAAAASSACSEISARALVEAAGSPLWLGVGCRGKLTCQNLTQDSSPLTKASAPVTWPSAPPSLRLVLVWLLSSPMACCPPSARAPAGSSRQ